MAVSEGFGIDWRKMSVPLTPRRYSSQRTEEKIDECSTNKKIQANAEPTKRISNAVIPRNRNFRHERLLGRHKSLADTLTKSGKTMREIKTILGLNTP